MGYLESNHYYLIKVISGITRLKGESIELLKKQYEGYYLYDMNFLNKFIIKKMMNMKKLIFIACCNIYKVVIDILKIKGIYDDYKIVGFLDDYKELTGKSIDGIEVLGTFIDLDKII